MNHNFTPIVTAVWLTSLCTAARADFLAPMADPFPPGLVYNTPPGCFPGLNLCVTNLESSHFQYSVKPSFIEGSQVGEKDEVVSLDALFSGTFTDGSFHPLGNFAVEGHVGAIIFDRPHVDDFDRTWSAQLTADDLHIIPSDSAAGVSLDLLLDANPASMGTISIFRVKDSPEYLIHNEFDHVFATLVIDGHSFDSAAIGGFPIVGTSVPEPSSALLLGAALAGLLGRQMLRGK